jgi:glucokinase
MISRILQLLLIDIMAVGISLGPQGEAAAEGDNERRRLLISHLDI